MLDDSMRVHTGEAICAYCGVGCRLWVEAEGNRLVRARGVKDAPANRGRLCPKGAFLPDVVDTPDRLRAPLVRRPGTAIWRETSWNTTLGLVADRLREILLRHGPDAVAFYGSGQLDTETAYLAGKLFKGCLGTNNIDSNSRLCMASAVAGYRSSLGSDGPPTCYDDINHADVVFILGSNMADAHPVTFELLQARKRITPGLTIIVVDPRRTRTAEAADIHLSVTPGGDIALLNALACLLLDAGAVNPGFIARSTRGFEQYQSFLREQHLESLSATCGVGLSQLRAVAAKIASAQAFLSFYSMGANQSAVGVWKNNSIINLHLLTGQIGKPGAGPFSLTGQPNAMGGRESGLLAHQLPGYRSVEEPADRAEIEHAWGLPPGSIAPRTGLTAVEMFRALEKGTLKAIWIAATNPAVSLPDLHSVRRGLSRAELVVVQDCYHPTETTNYAHVILPIAQWSEKEWTSTNSERMVSYSEKIVEPPGEARPDWEIVADVGRRLGFPGFEFTSAAEVWDEFRRLTAGRPCDMAGITAARLRRERSLQWPCPSEEHPGTLRRYTDGRFPTPDGRARFLPRPHRPPREAADSEFPLTLTTGRVAGHWHSRTRTAKVPALNRKHPEPFVEIHPDDAQARSVNDGDMALISSRRGCVRARAHVTETVPMGVVFSAFHWGDLFGPESALNNLTLSALDPESKQPEYKACGVQVERVLEPCSVPPVAGQPAWRRWEHILRSWRRGGLNSPPDNAHDANDLAMLPAGSDPVSLLSSDECGPWIEADALEEAW